MTIKRQRLPSQQRIQELLQYDPESGIARWKHRVGKTMGIRVFNLRFADHIAGCTVASGSVSITIDHLTLRLHRVIYKLMTGREPDFVDHIDHDPGNNVWTNLRECTATQSSCNRRIGIHNVTGYRGVTQSKSGRWRARVMLYGKHYSFGSYLSKQDAAIAASNARKHLHGAFANDR